MLERCVRYPRSISLPAGISRTAFRQQLLQHCRAWAKPLHASAQRTNTHDMGFITQPALRLDWELTGDEAAFRALVTAAHNLASRYDPRMRAIRSWDTSFSRRYEITDMETNFMVIVDSMCSMSLLECTRCEADQVLRSGSAFLRGASYGGPASYRYRDLPRALRCETLDPRRSLDLARGQLRSPHRLVPSTVYASGVF